jgi:hypothetical protein
MVVILFTALDVVFGGIRTLDYGSGSKFGFDSGSCSSRKWPSRCRKNKFSLSFLLVTVLAVQ